MLRVRIDENWFKHLLFDRLAGNGKVPCTGIPTADNQYHSIVLSNTEDIIHIIRYHDESYLRLRGDRAGAVGVRPSSGGWQNDQKNQLTASGTPARSQYYDIKLLNTNDLLSKYLHFRHYCCTLVARVLHFRAPRARSRFRRLDNWTGTRCCSPDLIRGRTWVVETRERQRLITERRRERVTLMTGHRWTAFRSDGDCYWAPSRQAPTATTWTRTVRAHAPLDVADHGEGNCGSGRRETRTHGLIARSWAEEGPDWCCQPRADGTPCTRPFSTVHGRRRRISYPRTLHIATTLRGNIFIIVRRDVPPPPPPVVCPHVE